MKYFTIVYQPEDLESLFENNTMTSYLSEKLDMVKTITISEEDLSPSGREKLGLPTIQESYTYPEFMKKYFPNDKEEKQPATEEKIFCYSLWSAEYRNYPLDLVECFPGSIFLSQEEAQKKAQEYKPHSWMYDEIKWLTSQLGQTTTHMYILQVHYIPAILA